MSGEKQARQLLSRSCCRCFAPPPLLHSFPSSCPRVPAHSLTHSVLQSEGAGCPALGGKRRFRSLCFLIPWPAIALVLKQVRKLLRKEMCGGCVSGCLKRGQTPPTSNRFHSGFWILLGNHRDRVKAVAVFHLYAELGHLEMYNPCMFRETLGGITTSSVPQRQECLFYNTCLYQLTS